MKLVIVLALCLSALVAVAAAGQLAAQTTTTGSDGTTTTTVGGDTTSSTMGGTTTSTLGTPSASPTTPTAAPVVLNLVEITRIVPAGTAAVTAFTVPAGQTLIVTDVVVTNTGAAATCGAAINRAGGAAAAVGTAGTTPTATGTATGAAATVGASGLTSAATPGTTVSALAGTITQSDSSITGPLCVAPRTTTPLPLTTGIEFGPGQTVQLMNVPDATEATGSTTTAGAVGFHLRGMLVAT